MLEVGAGTRQLRGTRQRGGGEDHCPLTEQTALSDPCGSSPGCVHLKAIWMIIGQYAHIVL